ncbi:hypothetical protein ACU4GD_25210 [Cupriavidus basilensis]
MPTGSLPAPRIQAPRCALHAHVSAAPQRPALHSQGCTIGYGALWRRVERMRPPGRHPGRAARRPCGHAVPEPRSATRAAVRVRQAGGHLRTAELSPGMPELSAIAAHAGIRMLFHDAPHAQAGGGGGGNCHARAHRLA